MKLVIPFFLSIILFSACNTSETTPLPPPNIVWIVSEDNSPLLGCYGDTLAVTPHLDQLAEQGILYENAFANAPVCAPSRSTLITGMYPTSLGTQPMRCSVEVPDYVRFFPKYLKEQGYYTSLRLKRDYNIPKQEGTWDKDDFWNIEDALKEKKEGQSFFLFYNTWMSHESKIHDRSSLPDYYKNTFKYDLTIDSTLSNFSDFDPNKMVLPRYLPDIPEMRDDWAWYYKAMQLMDFEVGQVLKFLEEEGLADNTIVIYSSDHGGVLGRSKRFCYESGLKIPMIVSVPEKYRSLLPKMATNRTDRMVSFVDMAPTILSLAGIEAPEHMQGSAFMGTYNKPTDSLVFGFRGRMDEAYDVVRTVRDKEFRYVRNYMPYRPNGQHIYFLWKAKSMSAWENSYKNGHCDSLQSAFFEARAPEELFDITNDPDNIYNLAQDPAYAQQLAQFRALNKAALLDNLDTGFLPEGDLWTRSKGGTIPYKKIIEDNRDECITAINAAEGATLSPDIDVLRPMLNSPYASVRFWGTTGCIILEGEAAPLTNGLALLLNDPSGDVAVTAAEALYLLGKKKMAINTLINALRSKNIYVQLRALNVIANRNISSKNLLAVITELNKDDEYIKNICAFILEEKSI